MNDLPRRALEQAGIADTLRAAERQWELTFPEPGGNFRLHSADLNDQLAGAL